MPWWFALAGLVLLHLTNPLTWGVEGIPLWFPTAGIGLVLIAWFGPRATLLVALDGLLVVGQALLLGKASSDSKFDPTLETGFALLTALELQLAWWIYHHVAQGARNPSDPRSAILFLLLVTGAVPALFAVDRWLLRWLIQQGIPGDLSTLWKELLGSWQSRALGILVLAPPLLTAVTPWLERWGLVPAEPKDEDRAAHPGHVGEDPVSRGGWVEIACVAAAGGLLGALLSVIHGLRHFNSWQLWGVTLLLVVWASLRRGTRGATIVAGTASAAALLAASGYSFEELFKLGLQTNMLSQCGVALLIGASASWIRVSETRYRQVVGHIPVVVYSARFVAPPTGGRPPPAEVILVSAASDVLLGCPPDQLLGDYERWLQRVHPDDREVVLAALSQLARQNQPVTCEYRLTPLPKTGSDPLAPGSSAQIPAPTPPPSRLVPRDGPVRWLRDTLAPNLTPEGDLTGWEGVVTDITEQRTLADDLRRTSSMFHALVANLPAGVFFVQGERGRPLLVNARARQLLGQREDVWAGLEQLSAVYRLFRADGIPYPVEELPVFQALRRGRTTMRNDIVVHRPDGKRLPLVSWAAPVSLGGPGQSDAAVWVLEDLTALHQAEAARRDTEGRLRAIIETMAEGLVVQDRTGAISDCNPAACSLLGHEFARMRGRSPFDLERVYLREDGSPLPPHEYPAEVVLRAGHPVRNVLLGIRPACAGDREPPAFDGDPVVSTGDTIQLTKQPTLHDSPATAQGPRSGILKSVRWVLVNALPLEPGTIPSGVVTTFSDITAYRQAEEGVRVSEEKYRGLVETLPLMLFQADQNLHVTYVNPAVRVITGYELEEIADPEVWKTIIYAEDLPRVLAVCQEALAGVSGRIEIRYRAKDGSEKVAFALVQPLRHEGELVGTTTLMVDITRERHLEEELRRAQRLELIGRLASGIAHDFNNLLSVVMSLTELARANLPDDHLVHTDLRRIYEASQQAANLSSQLLTFSKERRVTAHAVELNAVARRTLELLRATLPASIRLEADLGEPDLYVLADETHLQQVLMNLCINARDAMPNGGRLRVRTEAVTTPPHGSDAHAAGWVRLTVLDSGQGMSEQIRERIFDPYFSTKERGTGLGLAVVQQIVESYGGRIEVTSQPGQGARFDVWWPRTTAAEPAAEDEETIRQAEEVSG
jgi:PAS domain S-box-containing protein